MSTNAIQTLNLSRDFGTLRAVDDLSIQIAPGTVFGFLGPNGAGKTTTIRLLLGLLEPTEGHAEVLGYDVQSQGENVRLRCGALLEHNGLYDRLTALDNLELYGRLWHIPRLERQIRIRELLTHFDLWDRRNETVGQWSRGMKQKLAVARALLHRPSLVFMDEPTAGLDPVAAAALRDDLATLANREGVTVFLTTHNLTEAERLCQCVGVIRQGRLLALGSPEELRRATGSSRLKVTATGFNQYALDLIRARPEVINVTSDDGSLVIEIPPGTETAPLVSLLAGAGVQIEEVHKGKADLEQTFLSLLKEAEK
jgi:ABC-2 type transport system ATP-binding protein